MNWIFKGNTPSGGKIYHHRTGQKVLLVYSNRVRLGLTPLSYKDLCFSNCQLKITRRKEYTEIEFENSTKYEILTTLKH